MQALVIRRGSTVRLKLGKGLKGWLRMKRTEIRERRRENSVHKWMGQEAEHAGEGIKE